MTTTDRATPAASALADIVRMRNAAQAECDAARTPLEQPYLRGSLAVWDEAVVTIAADGAAACRRMADGGADVLRRGGQEVGHHRRLAALLMGRGPSIRAVP